MFNDCDPGRCDIGYEDHDCKVFHRTRAAHIEEATGSIEYGLFTFRYVGFVLVREGDVSKILPVRILPEASFLIVDDDQYALKLRVGRDYGNFGRNDIKILNRNKKKIQIGEVD